MFVELYVGQLAALQHHAARAHLHRDAALALHTLHTARLPRAVPAGQPNQAYRTYIVLKK